MRPEGYTISNQEVLDSVMEGKVRIGVKNVEKNPEADVYDLVDGVDDRDTRATGYAVWQSREDRPDARGPERDLDSLDFVDQSELPERYLESDIETMDDLYYPEEELVGEDDDSGFESILDSEQEIKEAIGKVFKRTCSSLGVTMDDLDEDLELQDLIFSQICNDLDVPKWMVANTILEDEDY